MSRRPNLFVLSVLSWLLHMCQARHHPDPDPLLPLLEHVAIERTVVLTQTSCPYLDFAENWILHVQHLGVRNFLVLVDDDEAFHYLDGKFKGHIVHPIVTSKASRHATKPLMHYDSPDFNKMMCERLGIQRRVLELGFSMLWTDMDTVWFEDITKIVPRGLDFVGAGDRRRFTDSAEEENKICGCMTFWAPTVPAKQALHEWQQKCVDSGLDDQRTLQEMWASGELKRKLSWYIMPWQLLPSGALLEQVRVDFSLRGKGDKLRPLLPAFIHANYRIGRESKRKFFQDRYAWMIPVEHEYPKCDHE